MHYILSDFISEQREIKKYLKKSFFLLVSLNIMFHSSLLLECRKSQNISVEWEKSFGKVVKPSLHTFIRNIEFHIFNFAMIILYNVYISTRSLFCNNISRLHTSKIEFRVKWKFHERRSEKNHSFYEYWIIPSFHPFRIHRLNPP